MAKKRDSTEDIISKLRQGGALLNPGKTVAEARRQLGTSDHLPPSEESSSMNPVLEN
jgi:hypothetical protein